MANDLVALEADYRDTQPIASRLATRLTEELATMMASEGLRLGVPIEARVKTWSSLSEKLTRKSIQLARVAELHDLIGLRLIFLFRRDVDAACRRISDAFDVVETEDTAGRLAASEFGYQSHHFVVRLQQSWLAVPSMSELGDLSAEIQVRTLAQHIWAATEHFLQYKQKAAIPPELRRTVYRASALLETVDLEFERLLESRAQYVDKIAPLNTAERLNVDLLIKLLSDSLPEKNRINDDPYGELLTDLLAFEIETAGELRELIKAHRNKALQADADMVQQRRNSKATIRVARSRLNDGVFFTHVGLVREMLEVKFGDKWTRYLDERAAKRKNGRESRGDEAKRSSK